MKKKTKAFLLIGSLLVSVYVGLKAYTWLKPEPIDEIDDIDDVEVDPSLLADED